MMMALRRVILLSFLVGVLKIPEEVTTQPFCIGPISLLLARTSAMSFMKTLSRIMSFALEAMERMLAMVIMALPCFVETLMTALCVD